MKALQIIAIAIISLMFVVGCDNSSSPTVDPNVKITAELATPIVKMASVGKIKDQIQSNEVDSIKIIRVRILMSRMMMHLENDNSTTGSVIKTEPFIYDLNTSGAQAIIGNHSVPAGLYEKVKVEIHRFSTSELSQYASNPIFTDFATSERNTILIEGITYLNGNPSTFTYKSNAVANLSLKMEPSLNLKNNSNTTIALQVDPNFFFKKWESILDPNDSKNTSDIENSLINTIKALKK